jgi:predicted dinucleotide-binding enzyme
LIVIYGFTQFRVIIKMATLDAGSLKRARELESVGFLQLTLAGSEKISWDGGFGLFN